MQPVRGKQPEECVPVESPSTELSLASRTTTPLRKTEQLGRRDPL